MEFRSLKVLDKLKPLFIRLGVDYPAMRKILELKLIMDARRIPTALQNKRGNNTEDDGNKMLRSLWIYVLISIMPGILSIFPMPIFSKVSLIMGISMFMVMSTMISDFSSVLLDIRDKNILLSFPVSSRTLATAKAVHIGIYLTLVTLSLNLLPIIGFIYSEGFGLTLLLVTMLFFMVITVIFLTSLLYVQVLKNFDGEKLKDLIGTIQITLTIVITLGYQLVARMFDASQMQFEFLPRWWTLFLPPAWFAAPFALVTGETLWIYKPLTLLGIVVPFVFLYLHINVISPAFEQNLSKLNSSNSGASKAYFRRNIRKDKLAKIFCRDRAEQTAFGFGYNILSTERELKQKVYPSIVLSIIFPFLLIATSFSSHDSFNEALDIFRNSNQFLWVYFSVLLLPTLFMLVGNSKHYKGAWIYKVVPIENPTALISGTYKSAIIRFGVLPYIITASFMTLIYGPLLIPHMLIAFFNMIYMVLMLIRINGVSLPFSKSFQVTQDSHIKGSMLGMLSVGLLAGLHMILVTLDQFGITLMFIILQCMLLIPAWRKTLTVKWSDLKS